MKNGIDSELPVVGKGEEQKRGRWLISNNNSNHSNANSPKNDENIDNDLKMPDRDELKTLYLKSKSEYHINGNAYLWMIDNSSSNQQLIIHIGSESHTKIIDNSNITSISVSNNECLIEGSFEESEFSFLNPLEPITMHFKDKIGVLSKTLLTFDSVTKVGTSNKFVATFKPATVEESKVSQLRDSMKTKHTVASKNSKNENKKRDFAGLTIS